MTWVKICGTTNLEDALLAVEAGADALGFVFYEKSPRKVDVEAVRAMVARLPERVEKVGVFVNESEEKVWDAVRNSGLTAVQMHGDGEDPTLTETLLSRRADLKIVAGVSMKDSDPEARARKWKRELVHSFLLDAGTSSVRGGSGQTFDWRASAPQVAAIKRLGRVVIAGGLRPTNVAEALEIFEPWGVDVASGVEARPGKKDPEKLRAFVQAVRAARKGA